MWNVNLLKATHTVEKTMAYVLYRWLMYLALASGWLLITLAGAGTAIAAGSFTSDPSAFATFGAIVGFFGYGWLMYRYWGVFFHQVLAGHLGLLVELLDGRSIPLGKAQIEHARQRTFNRFPGSRPLQQFGDTIDAVLKEIPLLHRAPASIGSGRLSPLIDRLAGWLNSLNGPLILAAIIGRETVSPRDASRAGLVCLFQHFRIFFMNRAVLLGMETLGWAVAFAVLLVPAGKIVAALPIGVGLWPYVFALIFGWTIKAGFLEPITTAALLPVFFRFSEGGIDPSAEQRLAEGSAHYRATQSQSDAR